MTIYQINYDLQKPKRDYEKIHDAIEELGKTIHPLDSTWFLDTSKDYENIRNKLKEQTNENDEIIITKLHSTWGHLQHQQQIYKLAPRTLLNPFKKVIKFANK